MIGERIRDCRESSGLRMYDLAKLVGTSVTEITNIERNSISPRISMLLKIAKVLNVSIDYLCDHHPTNSKYWGRVCDIQRNQTNKGLEKYGVPLESNERLTPVERVQYLEEELIDGLMYCEHLKEILKEQEDDLK